MYMYQPKYIGSNQIVNEVNVRAINYYNSITGSYHNTMIMFKSQTYNFYKDH